MNEDCRLGSAYETTVHVGIGLALIGFMIFFYINADKIMVFFHG